MRVLVWGDEQWQASDERGGCTIHGDDGWLEVGAKESRLIVLDLSMLHRLIAKQRVQLHSLEGCSAVPAWLGGWVNGGVCVSGNGQSGVV